MFQAVRLSLLRHLQRTRYGSRGESVAGEAHQLFVKSRLSGSRRSDFSARILVSDEGARSYDPKFGIYLGVVAAAAAVTFRSIEVEAKEVDSRDTTRLYDELADRSLNDDLAVLKSCNSRDLLRARSAHGHSLLVTAICEGASADAIRYLTSLGTYGCDAQGNSPLHYAVLHNRDDLIEHLGSYSQIRNRAGETALHTAIQHDRADLIKPLIAIGVPRDRLDNFSLVALAVRCGARRSLDALSPTETDLQQSIPGCGSLLHLAILNGQEAMVQELLENTTYHSSSATLLLREDEHGRIPFAYACFLGATGMAKFLRQKGDLVLGQRDLNYRDPNTRWTPVHWAASGGQADMLWELGRWGADFSLRDEQGRRPEDVASNKASQSEIESVLNARDAGAEVYERVYGRTWRNVVFQGGGPRGIAHIGALRRLRELGADRYITRVAGTSAGAITACMYAFGFHPDEMEVTLLEKNLVSLLDPDDQTSRVILDSALTGKNSGVGAGLLKLLAGGTARVIASPLQAYRELSSCVGLCKGENAHSWIEGLIQAQVEKIVGEEISSITFGELRKFIEQGKPFKHLHIYVTPISGDQTPICISSESSEWDQVEISSAVVASMRIPGVFVPGLLRKKEKRMGVQPWTGTPPLVDGGLLCNFGVGCFDQDGFNRETLGFNLEDVGERVNEGLSPPKSPLGLAIAAADIFYRAEELLYRMEPRNHCRVVTIPCRKVRLLDFDLSPDKARELIDAGYNAVSHSKLFLLPTRREYTSPRVCMEPPFRYYTGRADERRELRAALLDRALPYERRCIVHLISAFAGMGKSEFARKVVDEVIDPLDQSAWVFELDYANLDADYRGIAEALELTTSDEPSNEVIRRRVHRRLEKEEHPWYLIVHNADQVIDPAVFPKHGGHLLITSRLSSAWSNPDTHIALSVLNPDEAVSLLATVTGEAPSPEMEDLAQQLDYYPLALYQAARFIRGSHPPGEPNNYTVKGYRDLYSSVSPLDSGMTPDQSYRRTLRNVCDITFGTIANEDPGTWAWLRWACWWDPKGIPITWLKGWAHSPDSPDYRQADIEVLRRYGLIRDTSTETKTLSMHGLIQEGIRTSTIDGLPTNTELFYSNLLISLRSMEERDDPVMSNVYIRHYNSTIEHARARGMEGAEEFGTMLGHRARAFYQFGDYRSALRDCESEYRIKKAAGQLEPQILTSMYSILGGLYSKCRMPAKASKYLEMAIESGKKDLEKENDPIEAMYKLWGLFDAYFTLDKRSEAMETLEQIRKYLPSASQPLHQESIVEHYFGRICQEMADNRGAIDRFEESIDLSLQKREIHGETLSNKRFILDNRFLIARSHYRCGDYPLARDIQKTVLDGRRDLFSPNHPVIIESLREYANTLRVLGDIEKAIDLLAEAFEIGSHIHLGPDPELDEITEEIFACLNALDLKEKHAASLRFLSDCKKVYGDEHKYTLRLIRSGRGHFPFVSELSPFE